jgi:CRP-like cAMP-binding protein
MHDDGNGDFVNPLSNAVASPTAATAGNLNVVDLVNVSAGTTFEQESSLDAEDLIPSSQLVIPESMNITAGKGRKGRSAKGLWAEAKHLTDHALMEFLQEAQKQAEKGNSDEDAALLARILESKISSSKMISPNSNLRSRWDAAQAVLLAYIAFVVPYRIGFDDDAHPEDVMFWFDACIDIYFVIDVAMNFRTAYFTVDGEIEFHPKAVAKHYFHGWFVIDVLGCMPFQYVVYLIPEEDVQEGESSALRGNKLFRMLRLARLLKILRLARFKRLLDRWEEELYNVTMLKMAKLCVFIIVIGHWLCCAWYFFGTYPYEGSQPDGSPIVGWVQKSFGGLDVTASNRYVTSLYWAFMTMTTVGFGDIHPGTVPEKCYAIVAMLIGGFMFGLIVGSLSDVVQKNDPGSSARVKLLGKIHAYLHFHKIPAKLTRSIRGYFSNLYDHKSLFDERQMIWEPLPDKLRAKLAQQIEYTNSPNASNGILNKIPFFHHLDDWNTIKICCKLRRIVALESKGLQLDSDGVRGTGDLRDEYLMREGDLATEMFIVMDGIVAIEKSDIQLGRLRAGSFFGELGVLLHPTPQYRTRSAFTLARSELCLLSCEDLAALRTESAEIDKAIITFAQDAIHNAKLIPAVEAMIARSPHSAAANGDGLQLGKRLDAFEQKIGDDMSQMRLQLNRIERMLIDNGGDT